MLDLLRDSITGTEIVRLTSERSVQHHIAGPCVTPDEKWLVFVTHETGAPNLAAMELSSGDVRILTLRRDLNERSAAITRDGLAVVFSARDAVWAVTIGDGAETEIAQFSGARVRHLAVSPDGRAIAAGVAEGTWNRIVEVDVYDGRIRTVLETAGPVGRLEYEPSGSRILFAGDAASGIQVVDREGGPPRVAYHSVEGEWVTHATWVPPGAVAFVKLHDGLYLSEVETTPRCLFKGPIWHAAARRDGRLFACDTNAPDIGIVLVSPATGAWKVLCHPRSSNRGTQWFEPLPAPEEEDATAFPLPGTQPDGTETRYGPVWTHPIPSFHPDGRSVFYGSDATGVPQIYRAFIPDAWLEELEGRPYS
jgi:hypothetical protein